MTTPNPSPANTELLKIAASLGVDLNSLGSSTPAADPNNPPVFMGETSSREYRADGDVLRHRGGTKYGGTSTTIKGLKEANAAFYEMSEQDVAVLQRRLVGAGILDADKVRYGDYDDDTYSAFAAINERAARFTAVGKKLTPNDVLGMIERSFIASGGSVEPVAPGEVTATTDALSLEERVQEVARRDLGRKLRPSEIDKFATLYQGIERTFNATAASMQDTAAATGQDASIERIPSADVAAEQFVQANYAQEAAGQDAYGYLAVLRDMLNAS